MSDKLLHTTPDGRELRLSDLHDTLPEASSWGEVSSQANRAYEEGMRLGQSGDLAGAMERFDEAIERAPHWPAPWYQKAFCLVLQHQGAAALALYRKVDELEPGGYFTAKHAIHVLEREVAGVYLEGIYLYFLSHEWKSGPEERAQVMRDIVQRAPDFAAAWQKLAGQETDPARRLALLEKGLACDPDDETRGMLLLNKAAVLEQQGEEEAAVAILIGILMDGWAPNSARSFAKVMLRRVFE